mmetsp:Transcript_7637/g.10879  ORF Transcript_7637/g.10879 Transcript_7637/m.10879 type:complete len:359 (+) Transcript_7637:75-1151(+)
MSRYLFAISIILVFLACGTVHASIHNNGEKTNENNQETKQPSAEPKTAVVTLVTTSNYVAAAEVLALSLDRVNAQGDRILLWVSPDEDPRSDLTVQNLQDLYDIGWTKQIQLTSKDGTLSTCKLTPELEEQIRSNPETNDMIRYWGTCSKFAVWTLTDYDAVVYMDADSMALHNFDFVYEQIINGSTSFAAQGTPGCWETPPDCQEFYSAFMVIRPLPNINEYLHKLSDSTAIAEGDIRLLNHVITEWTPLPRYTLVAQSEVARPPMPDDPNNNNSNKVDWSQVKVYDFAGPAKTKPWLTYDLQKQTANKLAHPYFGQMLPDSKTYYKYMEPQYFWNEHHEEVLKLKEQRQSKEEQEL